MPTHSRFLLLATPLLAAGLITGCGSTPEPTEPQDDAAPLTEPAAEADAAQEQAQPETNPTEESQSETNPSEVAQADSSDPEPMTETAAAEPALSAEDAFQGSVPAWLSDEPFEFEGKLAVSASGTARTVRDARRAAVDAALAAFDTAARAQDMTEGGRVRQTTVAPLPEGGFIAYVLVAAER